MVKLYRRIVREKPLTARPRSLKARFIIAPDYNEVKVMLIEHEKARLEDEGHGHVTLGGKQ